MSSKKPVVLLVLDGWGIDEPHRYNAIARASTPNWDRWWQTMPHGLIEAAGEAVGLPSNQMGNSEVGHMHLGAGRVILQDFTRINQAIADHSWEANPALVSLLEHTKVGHTLHVLGLLSPGGVHSHEEHLFAFIQVGRQLGAKNLQLHLFLDGRDTLPQSAMQSLSRLETVLEKAPYARIASICGRYYAMDRDNRWERTQAAYRLITQGSGTKRFGSAMTALQSYYAQGVTDEFIPPTLIGPPMPMQNGDSVFCFNFRSDRVRQLIQALVCSEFSNFNREKVISFQDAVTMTVYEQGLPVRVAFEPDSLINTLGEVLSNNSLKQLRIAETEKYAHVTFFFNGGREELFPGESRILIPSPKVSTYDLSPEMSARSITQQLVAVIQERTYDVMVCNFANADMLGHTGVMSATEQAITCLDACMGEIARAVEAVGGYVMITSDHGNAEVMFDEASGQPHTAHTAHLVPFVFIGEGWHYHANQGSLIDVAPTLLALLDLPQPKEMTGHSLLARIT